MGAAGDSPDGIGAVAFDLDGTLYPNYRLYGRLVPALAAHPRFFRAFARVRHELHREAGTDRPAFTSFYDEQASRMAALLGEDPTAIREKAETLIYRRWESFFSGIALFPHVGETLAAFRRAGLALAVLSDFPPAAKIALLGLENSFDLLLGTEESGALKPSPLPFAALKKALGLESRRILYVGNHPRYDAGGARRAGMKTALLRRGPFSTGFYRPGGSSGSGGEEADFIFRDYRQLAEYVLG